MGRRRVLVLAPAITRMQCMSNPYERIEGGEAPEKEPTREGAVMRRTSFWSSWRKKKAVRRGGNRAGATGARRPGIRVTKLKIRMLSPLFWLKKARDSYVNTMLAIERYAPRESGAVATYPNAYPAYIYRSGYQSQDGGAAWVRPVVL